MAAHREQAHDRLKQLREALGLRSVDVCRQTGFSSSRWTQYEQGDKPLTLQAAIVLNKVYGVSLDWLFLGDRSGLSLRVASKLPPLLPDADAPTSEKDSGTPANIKRH